MNFFRKIVFVIGPSGIGKSSITKNLNTNKNVHFLELDKITKEAAIENKLIESGGAYQVLKKIGSQAFFILGMNSLFEAIGRKSNNDYYVVDVGAAFQNIYLLKHYSQLYNVICINARPQISHDRYIKHRDQRDLFTHCEVEFSPIRIDVYNSATYTIDTSEITLTDAQNEFNLILKEIWNE